MTIPPFPAPTPGDPDLPGSGLTPEERKDVKDAEASEAGSAWAPSDPSEITTPPDEYAEAQVPLYPADESDEG